MRAGDLDRQISIEFKSIQQDATYGTEVISWQRLITCWAQVLDMLPSRSESVQQGLAVARNQTRIRIRWRPDIASDMRVIVHGATDVIYQIVGGPAEVGGRKIMLEMVCERYSS